MKLGKYFHILALFIGLNRQRFAACSAAERDHACDDVQASRLVGPSDAVPAWEREHCEIASDAAEQDVEMRHTALPPGSQLLAKSVR